MELVWPFLSMIALSLCMLPIMFITRIRAVAKGQIRVSQFKFINLEGAPESVLKATRHFSNLFEMPVLFYALMLFCLHFQIHDKIIFIAAWCYVGLRLLHMTVHLTYNHVLHRMVSFFLSNLCLLIILIRAGLLVENFAGI